MPLFLDACALAKRYLPEHLSSRRIQEITSRSNRWGGFVVSSFVEPEVVSALAKYAREHPNYSIRFLQDHPAVVDRFRKDLSHPVFTIVGVDDEVVEEASEMLKQHPEYAIHAGDAVHLVTARMARAKLKDGSDLVFVTADRGLEMAARAEGFPTLNPLWQGITDLQTIVGTSSESS
ncbi:MAG TPA: type II toxin-antitoxin system VapC family toxin [Longimicrobium sp.]|nr:type II toxin-antitoxin system VapC family toxin [Longimicrobium sp.]